MDRSAVRAALRLVPPALVVAAGYAAGTWLLGDPSPSPVPAPVALAPGEQPGLEAGTAGETAAPTAPMPPPGDPATRRRNIPEVIRRFEERIADLRRQNEHADQVLIGYQRPPDYRLSSSEIEFRGRQATMLLQEKHATQKLIWDLERRIRELRQEYEQHHDAHNGE